MPTKPVYGMACWGCQNPVVKHKDGHWHHVHDGQRSGPECEQLKIGSPEHTIATQAEQIEVLKAGAERLNKWCDDFSAFSLNEQVKGLKYQHELRERTEGAEACVAELEEQRSICHGTYVGELDGKPVLGNIHDGTDAACPGWWRGQEFGWEKGKASEKELVAQLAVVVEFLTADGFCKLCTMYITPDGENRHSKGCPLSNLLSNPIKTVEVRP